MLLALVLSVQAATAAPNPCADQMSTLCKISPLFCPSAYPSDLAPGSGNVPCWPERATTVSRNTRTVSRPASATVQQERGATKPSAPSAAPSASPRRDDARTQESRGFARIPKLR
jgi:hypothetical protein